MRETGYFTLQFYHGETYLSSMFNFLFPRLEGEEKIHDDVFEDITHRFVRFLNNNGYEGKIPYDNILKIGDNRFLFDVKDTYINKDDAFLMAQSMCYFVILEYNNEIKEKDLTDLEKEYIRYNIEHVKMMLEDIRNGHCKYVITEN